MTRTREGTACAMYCAECKRPIAVGAPSFAIDGTMTRFRCAACQLAARVKRFAQFTFDGQVTE